MNLSMLDNYHIDEFGVIHQTEFSPIEYDHEYLTYYEKLSDRTIKLGYQRMGWLLGYLQHVPESVLEIGYGIGSFIEAAKINGVSRCAGCDVEAFPLPEGVEFADWETAMSQTWELVAMYDVLEHIPDLSFLSKIKCRYMVIAVPFCRWKELGDDWFRDWRMLLPNEHLHHFDTQSLVALMEHCGFKCLDTNFFEDPIRLRPGETGPNILSAMFERLPLVP